MSSYNLKTNQNKNYGGKIMEKKRPLLLFQLLLLAKESYYLEFQNKYPIITNKDGKRILIATGLIKSFALEKEEIYFHNEEVSLEAIPPKINKIRENLKIEIDAVIGLDILSTKNLSFILSEERLEVNGNANGIHNIITSPDVAIPNSNLFLSGIEFRFLNGIYSFIFDSCATNTFILPEFADKLEETGVINDWSSAFGNFTSKAFKAKLGINNVDFNLNVGILPEQYVIFIKRKRNRLEGSGFARNIAGVIGYDLIKELDFRLYFHTNKKM